MTDKQSPLNNPSPQFPDNRPGGNPAAAGEASQMHEAELRESEMDRMVEPEYASVSGTAIVALMLAPFGLLSLMTVYFTMFGIPVPILLIVPLFALAVALAAVNSIRRSEGTRVGLKLAVLAALTSGLILLSAGIWHVAHLRHQTHLHDTLVQAALGDMQLVFTGQYESVYNRMVLNNPAVAKASPYKVWLNTMNTYLYTAGDYYGSQIEAVRLRPPMVDEEEPDFVLPEVEGLVVRRMIFQKGSVDLSMHYARIDGQWRLIGLRSDVGTEFGREGPIIERWEDELTGGQPSYWPPSIPRPQPGAEEDDQPAAAEPPAPAVTPAP